MKEEKVLNEFAEFASLHGFNESATLLAQLFASLMLTGEVDSHESVCFSSGHQVTITVEVS